jgi:pyruvate dehydrogenase E2 component (dihydrolipoamide acetyltransferase)
MPPGGVPASPLARKIAQDKGIDLRNISGSGPGGRVVKADVEAAAAAGPAAAGPSPTPAPVAAPVAGESLPISDKRRIIAQRLSESFYTAPHFFLRVVVDVEKFLDARARWNEGREKRLGLNSFLMKFTTQALLRHPEVNASWQADAIVRHGAVHIGLAVAQPDGLITPTVKNCERKGIEAIDTEINALVAKARENRLSPEEYTGSTFTISNLGSFGVRDFTAIINPPNAAILAVGEVVKQPVVGAQDTIEIRRQMTLTLSGDHRILDGAVAARFMADLRAMLEDPVRALL